MIYCLKSSHIPILTILTNESQINNLDEQFIGREELFREEKSDFYGEFSITQSKSVTDNYFKAAMDPNNKYIRYSTMMVFFLQ